MNLTSMAIGRPITTVMLCVAVLIFGTLSLFQVPVDLLPDVNFPVITVETRIAGYSPVEVEDLITKPVEGMVSTMNHVQRVSSTSSEGLSRVEIRFALGTNMDYVAAEVSERINLIRDTFPKDARNPQVKKYNPSEAPVISVAAYGDLPAVRLRQIVEDVLGKRLKRIEGVGNVEIKGGKEREIIVEIDHGRLKAYGLSIEEIADSLKANNMNVQVGSVVSGSYRLTARAEGGYGGLSQIETMGIRSTSSGSVIPLKELGRVSDAFRREENRTRFQGEPRVVLYVQKESGANVIRISEDLRRELDRLQDELPKELKLEIIYDQADYIQASIKRLRNEALIGAGLAMIVIFLFLRNLQSVFVIGAAIPVSIIATFTMMHLFGITLNIISLSGFTLGVGMLVDNAIVVMENISKKRVLFSDRTRAALLGTGEVIKAITVSTFAHIAVFMPVIFLQKKIKLLYSGLFFTVSFSLLASLLVALTLVPLVTSRLRLHPTWGQERKLGSYRWYRHFLVSCLRHRGKIITGGVILFGGSLLLTPLIGFEPMARMDRGAFSVIIRTPPGTSLSGTDETAKEAERILLDSPHVKDVSTEVGEETVTLRVRLISDLKRVKTTRQVVEELRPQLAAIPRAQSHFDVDTGTGSGNKIILEVNGHDQKELATLALEVKRRVLTLEGIKDVVIYQTNPKPELLIKVLHDKAGAYGLDATRISEAVRSRITGPIATEFVEQGKETDLRIRLQNDDLKNLSVFNNISLPVALNAKERVLVPLGEVTTSELVLGTAEIHRKDQHRMISISADIGSEDLGRAAVRVGEALKDFPFPEGYSYNFGEDYQELKESQKEMIFSLFLAILFVYMILAALFESFLYPITIMASVPMAAIGCLVILYVSGKSINVPVYVGAITLAGIVVNNAVVLIDYIKLLKSRGMGRWRAIIRGGENRLRPILMTSGTTLLALLPMALDTGEGSNLWSPLAVTIIGGLITSTLLTLIVIPLLASFVEER